MSHRYDPVGICLIAAVGRRGEIGFRGRLLFRLKDDMANFRAATKGKPLIMGRKTWDSLPKRPLPGRANIVVTRNRAFSAPDARVISSLGMALAAGRAIAAMRGATETMVIGGAGLYAATLPLATSMVLTEVDAEAEADVMFPSFDRAEWIEREAVRFARNDDNEASFVIRRLERRPA